MATPGFQELLESRIKNYFSCTKRLVRGYISKNYFIPPQPRRRTFQVLIYVQKALQEKRRLLHSVCFQVPAPQWYQSDNIRFMARHQHWPNAQNCCARFLNLCIYYVRTQIIIILNSQRIQNRKYDRRCVHPEFIFK